MVERLLFLTSFQTVHNIRKLPFWHFRSAGDTSSRRKGRVTSSAPVWLQIKWHKVVYYSHSKRWNVPGTLTGTE
jgi:hypothetical protein